MMEMFIAGGTLSNSLIWSTGAAVLVALLIASSTYVKLYEKRGERDSFVSIVCVLTLTSLLATICLLPVDIALVSSTTNNKTGQKKDWATDKTVHNIILGLKVVYYSLYSLDAVLCLLATPFAYFWYEEWDTDSTTWTRLVGAAKYSIFFLALMVILLLVGFFAPAVAQKGKHADLDFFRKLLIENHGERALTFIIGVLLSLGTVVFVAYTAPGFALFPITLIKKIPALSVGTPDDIQAEIIINHELQRAINSKYVTLDTQMNTKDRKELNRLLHQEKKLRKKKQIAEESRTEGWWGTVGKVLRPIRVVLGVLLLAISALIWVSILITGIDKATHSRCGARCGYILAHLQIFNPVNYIFIKSSHIFPVDYILTLLTVLLFFLSTIIGLTFIGIRFLWIRIFSFRRNRTDPRSMLISTVLLSLAGLALNYYLAMLLFPDYATFGGQLYCAPPSSSPPGTVSCENHPEYLLACTEESDAKTCTPSVMSSFLNRITLNFPFFGAWAFWGSFVFLGVSLVCLLGGIVRTPSVEGEDDDEIDEEEALLGN